jgi:hypothetical protein
MSTLTTSKPVVFNKGQRSPWEALKGTSVFAATAAARRMKFLEWNNAHASKGEWHLTHISYLAEKAKRGSVGAQFEVITRTERFERERHQCHKVADRLEYFHIPRMHPSNREKAMTHVTRLRDRVKECEHLMRVMGIEVDPLW